MKQISFLIGAAMLLAACNEGKPSNAAAKKEIIKGGHHQAESKNSMMQAMDESMIAMHKVKQTGNADYDFAAMMIPHHEGAIVMAKAVIKEGKSLVLIDFAKGVISAQETEIKELNKFLKTAVTTPAKDAEKFKIALSASMKPMMDGMTETKLTGNAEQDFVALMIPHHQSAVDMAKAYLPYAKDSPIKMLANEIIKSQQKEIKWLKEQR